MLTSVRPERATRPKRFYKAAEAAVCDGEFGVLLDGRRVRTPAGLKLAVPTLALAELIAAEWAAQGEFIAIADMHATRLAYTAADKADVPREAFAEGAARYAGADVICYFADGPDSLVARQGAEWGALIDWAAAELGLRLVRVTGVLHQPQPEGTLERARALALELTDYALIGLAFGAALYKSTVLAFAVQRGRLSGVEALELSRLDEAFQEERWGVDADAAARTARQRTEAQMLDDWFKALGQA